MKTPIMDEINRKIDDEKHLHFASDRFNEEFKPSIIYMTPKRYLEFMQEWSAQYSWMGSPENRTWRGAEIVVQRDTK